MKLRLWVEVVLHINQVLALMIMSAEYYTSLTFEFVVSIIALIIFMLNAFLIVRYGRINDYLDKKGI